MHSSQNWNDKRKYVLKLKLKSWPEKKNQTPLANAYDGEKWSKEVGKLSKHHQSRAWNGDGGEGGGSTHASVARTSQTHLRQHLLPSSPLSETKTLGVFHTFYRNKLGTQKNPKFFFRLSACSIHEKNPGKMLTKSECNKHYKDSPPLQISRYQPCIPPPAPPPPFSKTNSLGSFMLSVQALRGSHPCLAGPSSSLSGSFRNNFSILYSSKWLSKLKKSGQTGGKNKASTHTKPHSKRQDTRSTLSNVSCIHVRTMLTHLGTQRLVRKSFHRRRLVGVRLAEHSPQGVKIFSKGAHFSGQRYSFIPPLRGEEIQKE